MSKQASFNRSVVSANALAESALFASRQVWLAGLGAAVVTREWARHEAGNTFRTLVKEGTAVESNAIRVVGDRVESSVATRELRFGARTRTPRSPRPAALAETAAVGAAQRQDSRVRRKRCRAEAAQAREEPRGQSARRQDRPQRQAHRQKVDVA